MIPVKILILGLGVTGISVIRHFHRKADLIGFDEGFDRFSPDLRKLLRAKLSTLVTDRRLLPPRIREADRIIVSPGIPLGPLGLSRDNPKVIGDVDLAYDLRRGGKFLAVTGTNGKTTTTKLLASILSAEYGKSRVVVAGNIGTPLLDEVGKKRNLFYVVELSSFQLELAKRFRPAAGIFLNLSQNHLDRHKTMRAYFEAKARLFQNCRRSDVAVVNLDDAYGAKLCKHLRQSRRRGRIWGYTLEKLPASLDGLYLQGQTVYFRSGGKSSSLFNIQKHMFGPGKHNLSNLLGAAGAATAAGVKPAAIVSAARRFRLPAHRLEFVKEVGGVAYYDDSKATSVDAARKAMESFPSRQIIALMGGQDKGMDFTPLFRELTRRRNLKYLVFFGALGEKFSRLAGRFRLPHRRVARVAEAVSGARQLARAGDVVLLSPGGTSFDQYTSYAERGQDFRKCVERLK